ncbi:MAG: S8 family serine peptidase [Promethearchaeota archaeon]
MKFKKQKLEILRIIALIVLISGIIPFIGTDKGYSTLEIPKLSTTEDIIINSPDGRYDVPMMGYYPAVYGFENDVDNSYPDDWSYTLNYGDIDVLTEVDGHKKILRLYDGYSYSGSPTEVYQSIDEQNYGTIELYIRQDDLSSSNYRTNIKGFGNIGNDLIFIFRMIGGTTPKFQVKDGSTWTDITGAPTPDEDTWYHIRIDFRGSYESTYESLIDQYTYKISIDGVAYGTNYDFDNNLDLEEVTLCTYSYGYGYNIYFDAIGYSWEAYNPGDNLYEGLLLDIEPDHLDDMEYTIDGGQTNVPILGDSVIPFPETGTYKLEVSGNYGSEDYYGSNIFSIGCGVIDVNSPIDGKTYTPRMSGDYSATYSFESDEDGSNPNGWTTIESGGYINVINEKKEHNKVVEFYKSEIGDLCEMYQTFDNQPSGTIEFWFLSGWTARKESMIIYDEDTKLVHIIFDSDGKLTYHDSSGWNEGFSYSSNIWYWVSITIDMTTDTYDLLIYDENGNKKHDRSGDTLWVDTQNSFNTLKFAMMKYGNNWYAYIDSVGYSWEDYNPGDNYYDIGGHYPGTFSFENDENGETPDGWYDDNNNGQIIEKKDGHNKVYEMVDDSLQIAGDIYQEWDSTKDHGTVEFWMRFTSKEKDLSFCLRDSNYITDLCCLKVKDGKFKILDYGISHDIININPEVNKWYHIKLVFKGSYIDTGYGGIPALTKYMYRIYINGELTFTQQTSYYDFSDQKNPKFFQVYTSDESSDIIAYFDAVGYSWDPTYYIGNNRVSGFFLDFSCETELTDIKYELNGGGEKPIIGKTILPITLEGPYTVKVMGAGIDSAYYESEKIEYYTAPLQDLDNLWGLTAINADDVWGTYNERGEGVKVLIIDTGIDIDHPDLIDNYGGGKNFYGSSEDPPEDIEGHGTQCAGIIGALDDDFGIIGIAPEVELYTARVTPDGKGTLDKAKFIAAINWGIEKGVDIISMSLKCTDDSGILTKLNEAYNDYGIILVAASGNDNEDSLEYPAIYANVISVGAISPDYKRWTLDSSTGSNYHDDLDIVAPGEFICSTFKKGGYKGFITPFDYPDVRGTSFACPMVVGVCALILSANPDLEPFEVRECLKNTACTSIIPNYSQYPQYYGAGLVDASAAVYYALNH